LAGNQLETRVMISEQRESKKRVKRKRGRKKIRPDRRGELPYIVKKPR